jgi:tyrosyl-tRNA synthetase
MASMEAGEKLALINESLAEVLNPELIESVLAEGRNLRIYWGSFHDVLLWFLEIILTVVFSFTRNGPDGTPSLWILRSSFENRTIFGSRLRPLLADIHGFLDNLKAPIELVEYRVKFYRLAISSMLESVGVPTERLQFVLGSSFQKSPEYAMDVYRLCSLVSEHEAKKAGAEIVKQSDNAPLSGLLSNSSGVGRAILGRRRSVRRCFAS